MSRFNQDRFMQAWIEAVNSDPTFNAVTRWFDGSILLADVTSQCWLKVYGGKVIDRLPFMPPLGYTFKVSAPDWAWDALVTGTRFTELFLGGRRRFSGPDDFVGEPNRTPPTFALEGDLMSAQRVVEAIYVLADHYASTARALAAAA
ncbi:hypothetical protein [Mycobacterium sp. 852002-51057_SCH5723018]|uniref:hypothetical protein n=1 Tax=Mycobacterium sp. 852002-51057_SCH5723018 TaxID=1834094 RepID=UPI000800A874|nr:hypothetical protein [Mycobacterium sp. 852002-51057_SCH5723018]OBG24626.1 hypothetical protein A5764_09535 [Mycobacterium sp. 852002-51057_SCH5723018]